MEGGGGYWPFANFLSVPLTNGKCITKFNEPEMTNPPAQVWGFKVNGELLSIGRRKDIVWVVLSWGEVDSLMRSLESFLLGLISLPFLWGLIVLRMYWMLVLCG